MPQPREGDPDWPLEVPLSLDELTPEQLEARKQLARLILPRPEMMPFAAKGFGVHSEVYATLDGQIRANGRDTRGDIDDWRNVLTRLTNMPDMYDLPPLGVEVDLWWPSREADPDPLDVDGPPDTPQAPPLADGSQG